MFTSAMNAHFHKQIDKLKKDGIFLPDVHATTADARYLFISSGGTGFAALAAVKDAIKTHLAVEEQKKFRFLAVDTDRDTNRSYQRLVNPDGTITDRILPLLDVHEFFVLSPHYARSMIDTSHSALPDWLDPELVEQVQYNMAYLDGSGVGAIPQLAKLCLWSSKNGFRLRNQIEQLILDLQVGTNPLYIFYLTGLSGGTGAGTVIDLPYLIRNSIPHFLHNQSTLCGFLLMPPTGRSSLPVLICSGNATGYAALKEVDHFMGLSTRGETYTHQYSDGYTVTSGNNLFDSCYLLEGNSTYIFNNNPREHALQLLAETILDMVSSAVSTTGAVHPATNLLVRNTTSNSAYIVSRHSVNDAPRNVNYVYSTLGHCSVSLPLHELRTYVARQCFDRIHKDIPSQPGFTKEDPREFLRRILAQKPNSMQSVRSVVDQQLQNSFLGTSFHLRPRLILDFLQQVCEEAEQLLDRLPLVRPYFARNEELEHIIQYIHQGPEKNFLAFDAAMDGMREVLEHQFSEAVVEQSGQVMLKCLTKFPGKPTTGECVMEYLNSIVSSVDLREIHTRLSVEMMKNPADWTALLIPDEQDPDRGIRAISRFWNQTLDRILTVTTEDLLIKMYSNNPDARFDPANPTASVPALQTAAQSLYHCLTQSAESDHSVSFTHRTLWLDDFRRHPILMVPKDAPHLYNELYSYANHIGAHVWILFSGSPSRIACCQQFCGFPALAMSWTHRAERDYETQLITNKLYSIFTCNGTPLANFPNLIPWNYGDAVNPLFRSSRETRLAQEADDLLRSSFDLGLTRETILPFVGPRTGGVKILPSEYRPSVKLIARLNQQIFGSASWQQISDMLEAETERCAQELFSLLSGSDPTKPVEELENKGVALKTQNLLFPGIVIAPGPTDNIPDWDFRFAAMMLRTLPETMLELEATVRVMNCLREKIDRSHF